MLWMKGWYETRVRLLVVAALTVGFAALVVDATPADGHLWARPLDLMPLTSISVMAAVFLAGAGIKTQPGFQNNKGIHGSMYYTLSLPVTRTRLLGVRVALGLAEVTVLYVLAYCAVWLRPEIRLHADPLDMLKHGVAAFFCVLAVYSWGVVLATFLDDFYQMLASCLTIIVFIMLLNRVPHPPAFDTFLIVTSASPLITHTMPWIPMATLLALSGILLLVATRIVQSREY